MCRPNSRPSTVLITALGFCALSFTSTAARATRTERASKLYHASFELPQTRGVFRVESMATAEKLVIPFARAFAEEPFLEHIVRGPNQRHERRMDIFRWHLEKYLQQGLVYATPDHQAGVMLSPPGIKTVTPGTLVGSIFRVKRGVGGWKAVINTARAVITLDRHEMKDPHLFIFSLGTDPDSQGQGKGSLLMEHVAALCEANDWDAYLTTHEQRTVGFYERHGFEVAERPFFLPDGPESWPMIRRRPSHRAAQRAGGSR